MEINTKEGFIVVIGNGMMSKAFNNYRNDPNIIVFASGVSNSRETNKDEYKREELLLLENISLFNNKLFIYFSTVSIYDSSLSNGCYVKHKLRMEGIIQEKLSTYYIFRLPQVVGKTKSPTLVNVLSKKIKSQELFDVWKNSTRNLIDCKDIYRICSQIIESKSNMSTLINIANPVSFKVNEIVNTLESILNMKANYNEVDFGISYSIDISIIKQILSNDDEIFKVDYTQNILKKYVER